MMTTNVMSKMPQGTAALFSIQIVSTLSFSVLYSTLVLYMKNKLGMSMTDANSIMGVFIAFNFALHLLGGVLGGRLLSNRMLFSLGMIAQVIGCVLLSMEDINYLYYGLAAFLAGSGLNVTCVNCMLTQLFSPEDSRRETAFLWNYAGMNVGFFVGFTMSGVFQLSQNYQRLFLLSSLGNMIALLICLYFWSQLADKETSFVKKSKSLQKQSTWYGVILIALLPFVLSYMLHHADWSNKLVLITGIIMLGVVIRLARLQPTQEAKNKIFAFAILMLIGTVFWMLYQICPMGLTHFIDHNVRREYADWVIAPQWFQNVNTVSIVIGGPLLGIFFQRLRARGVDINIPSQFALALLFIGLAFVILPVGIFLADSQGMINPGWIVVCYVLQSLGELLISPIGYAMIGYLAPAPLQGVMMGMWMLDNGVGATLASYSSNLMVSDSNNLSPLATNAGYSNIFFILGIIAIGSSVILAALTPFLRRLIQNQKSVNHTIEPSIITEHAI